MICTSSLSRRGYIRVPLWKDEDSNSRISMRQPDKDWPWQVLGLSVIPESLDGCVSAMSSQNMDRGNKNSTLENPTLGLQPAVSHTSE